MKYLKEIATYKKEGRFDSPSLGDYVYCICNDKSFDTQLFNKFLKNNIGQIIEMYNTSMLIKIKYHNIPPECEDYFFDFDSNSKIGTKIFNWSDVVEFNKDPELLQEKISGDFQI